MIVIIRTGGNKMKNNTLKWVNTVSFIVMVAVNALANVLPIGIGNTGAVSAKYPNLFTPAPATFSIWGIIYLLMALFILYQWGIFGSQESREADLHSVGLLFAVSCALNIGWIFSWHFDLIGLSLVMIILLMIFLAVIGRQISKEERKGLSYMAVNAGFDFYFGWIIAAVIANISVFLVSIGWNRFGLSADFWTVIVLLVGAVIGAAPVFLARKWFSSAAVVWAYVGILIRHISQTGYAGRYPVVIAAAILGIVIILLTFAMEITQDKETDRDIIIAETGKS